MLKRPQAPDVALDIGPCTTDLLLPTEFGGRLYVVLYLTIRMRFTEAQVRRRFQRRTTRNANLWGVKVPMHRLSLIGTSDITRGPPLVSARKSRFIIHERSIISQGSIHVDSQDFSLSAQSTWWQNVILMSSYIASKKAWLAGMAYVSFLASKIDRLTAKWESEHGKQFWRPLFRIRPSE